MADIRQTAKYAKYLEKIGWRVERAGKTYFFIKSAPLVGSIIKIQRPEEIDPEAFRYVCKKCKAFLTIIEPKNNDQESRIKDQGFKTSNSPYLPTKTLHLDLTNKIEKLYSGLKKDARYSLRQTRDLKIYAVEKIHAFRISWKMAVGLRLWVPPGSHLEALKRSFEQGALFLVTPDGESGAIFLYADEIAYYWQAFSSKKGRKQSAQYKILWSGIVWAKKRGAKIFDFEGIYDERFPNKRWKGFTHFKKSFGGYEVEYPGAFIKFLIPKL